MRLFVFLFSFFFVVAVPRFWAQGTFSPEIDTIQFTSYTTGSIDTFDISFGPGSSLLPGGGFSNGYQYLSSSWLSSNPRLLGVVHRGLPQHFVFSALPHLGFAYSFGSKGNQNIKMDYAQSFGEKGLLNMNLLRNSSNGFVRNSNFDNAGFTAGYLKNKGWYKIKAQGIYHTDNRNLYGGITDSLSFQNFGIDFAPVLKQNAKSSAKIGEFQLENRWSLSSDSSLLRTGPASYHSLRIYNKVYSETDTLYGLYPQINIDSLTTRDQYQENTISNGIGWFFDTKALEFSGFLNYRARALQNLGVRRDTQEVNFKGLLGLNLGKVRLNSIYYLNLFGAKNEFSFSSDAHFALPKIKFYGRFYLENLVQDMWQRQYFGNVLNYQNALSLQNRVGATGGVEVLALNWLDVHFSGGFESRRNMLTWTGASWGIGSFSNIDYAFFKIRTPLTFRNIVLNPFYELNVGISQLPSSVAGGRLTFKKKVFKAKKMELVSSIDYVYVSSYQLMRYVSTVDVFQANSSFGQNAEQHNLHVTLGFGIDEFRFFVRGENLNRIGNPSINQVAINYYASPFALRVGISWDFFN